MPLCSSVPSVSAFSMRTQEGQIISASEALGAGFTVNLIKGFAADHVA